MDHIYFFTPLLQGLRPYIELSWRYSCERPLCVFFLTSSRANWQPGAFVFSKGQIGYKISRQFQNSAYNKRLYYLNKYLQKSECQSLFLRTPCTDDAIYEKHQSIWYTEPFVEIFIPGKKKIPKPTLSIQDNEQFNQLKAGPSRVWDHTVCTNHQPTLAYLGKMGYPFVVSTNRQLPSGQENCSKEHNKKSLFIDQHVMSDFLKAFLDDNFLFEVQMALYSDVYFQLINRLTSVFGFNSVFPILNSNISPHEIQIELKNPSLIERLVWTQRTDSDILSCFSSRQKFFQFLMDRIEVVQS